MASLSEVEARISALKSQGKTESTSKKLGKLVRQREQLRNSGGGGGGSYDSAVQRALELQRQITDPLVQSLQSSIPEIEKRFETQGQQLAAETEPLKQRFQGLLDRIKGKYQETRDRQTVATRNELARRGISSGSGLFERELSQALRPIESEEAGLVGEVGSTQEQELRNLRNLTANLPLAATQELRAVQNAMAQLQAGAGQSAIENAQRLLAMQEQQRQFDVLDAFRNRQQDLQDKIFGSISLPESQANLSNINSLINQRGKETNAGTGYNDLLTLLGYNFTPAPNYFTPDS